MLVFLAGPNGAGKSTFFRHFLEDTKVHFVNGDVVAAKLRSLRSRGSDAEIDALAFRATQARREALLAARASFCTESVFSDPVGAKLDFLRRAGAEGYAVFLVFVGLAGPALSMARVMQRVEEGGHDVPDEKLKARYPRTMANLEKAIPLVEMAFLFDNSDADHPFRAVAVYQRGRVVERFEPSPAWAARLRGL